MAQQTRTWAEVVGLTQARAGAAFSSGTELTNIGFLLNSAARTIYDESRYWERFLVLEPRTAERGYIATTEDSINVYGAGTTEANGLYVRNGNSVDTNPKYTLYNDDEAVYQITSTAGSIWAIQEVASGDILYSSIGGAIVPEGIWTVEIDGKSPAPIVQALSNIGEFVRIHNTQPLLNRSAREYDFYVTSSGAHILNVESTTDNTAWVTYKKEFTPYTITADYYTSTLEVPAEFFNFISHAVYADFLRVQNKQEEALAEEQAAQTFLALELEKIDLRSNNNTINKKFSTYVNRQAR